jgi:hypothetical protein
MKTTLLALVAILCLTFVAFAQDFSGKWVRDPNAPAGGGGGRGGMATYDFKVSGMTLTGSVSQAGRGGGDPVVIPITDGKITGSTFTFSYMRPGRGGGDPMKVVYSGKIVAADKLEITADTGRGPITTPLVKAP